MYLPISKRFTNSQQVYLSEWRKLNKMVEKKLNVTVTGFDPDILITCKVEKIEVCKSIPVWLAKRIVGLT